MRIRDKRGQCLSKHCEGSCQRRKNKLARQAGSPESANNCNCTTCVKLIKTANRLAYAIRTGHVTAKVAFLASSTVAECRRRCVTGKFETPRRRRKRSPETMVPLRHRKINFVSAKEIEKMLEPEPYVPRRVVQSVAVLRYRDVPNLAYDSRCAGTWMEAHAARVYRAAQADVDHRRRWKAEFTDDEAKTMADDPVMQNLTFGKCSDPKLFPDFWCALQGTDRSFLRVDPFPRAPISDYELGRVLIQGKEDTDFVDYIKDAAPNELLELLSGESWGVIDFTKFGKG